MAKTRNHSITFADLNEVIDVLIDDRTALKRGIMSLIDQAFKEGKNPPKTTKEAKQDIFLRNATKLCKYPCDIENRTISVAVGKEQEALEDLTVSYLINTLRFSIQSCIPDHAQEIELFNPDFTKRAKSIQYTTEVILPKRGEVWKFCKERWYIKSVTDVAYTIMYLQDLRGDMKKSISEVERMVSKGELTLEVRH